MFWRRRSFLGIAGAAAIAACTARHAPAPAPASPDEVERFVKLSQQLTGFADLDSGIGATYLQNVRSNPQSSAALDTLFDSAQTSDPAARALTAQIVRDWYSGTYAGSAGRATATWTEALAWRACAFTKPPSVCAVPGSWQRPPA
jgi:Membrane bound FAD containing D-sorbitol dehydrogenase